MDKLFTLMQLTREQVQYGYGPSGMTRNEQGDLAAHHYLVTFIAWQIGKYVNSKGGNVDILKAIEISLVHDLGELFGGDINFHYARVNPEAREAAKKFEAENHKFLAEFFGHDKDYVNKLYAESLVSNSDEAAIAKIADLMECLYFKKHRNKVNGEDMPLTIAVFEKQIEICSDKLKPILKDFINEWQSNFNNQKINEIIWEKKK